VTLSRIFRGEKTEKRSEEKKYAFVWKKPAKRNHA